MYLLISIVFIAELIIAITVLTNIVKADRCITALNNQIVTGKNDAAIILSDVKNVVINLKSGVNSFIEVLKRKQEEYVMKVLQTVILYALMIFCKGKYKKVAIVFQFIVAINDYMRDNAN